MQTQRLTLSLLTLLTFAGLSTYAYIGNFTRMLADDFCSLYYADRLGLLRSIWYWYLNWSGRYTAFAADWAILKVIFGPYNLHYIVPITIILWLMSAALAIYLYLRGKSELALLHSLILAGIFLFLVFLLSPNIPQSLYWWNGMRSYALPLAVLNFYILLFQVNRSYWKMNGVAASGLGFVLFFLSGGLSETITVAQTVFLFFIAGLQFLKLINLPRNEVSTLFASLAGSISSMVVVILAPGNAVRQSFLPPSPAIPTIASISVQAYRDFIGEFFLEPAQLLGLIGAVLTAMWIGAHYKEFLTVQPAQILAYLFGGIVISFACFPPGVYGYSEPPPTRTMMIPVFFLMAGILCAGFLAGAWLVGRFGPAWAASSLLLFSIVMSIGFSTISTIRTLYPERQVYFDFAEKWDTVDAQILQAKAGHLASVNIPAMDNWAGLERPTPSKTYWPNVCFSLYYDIQVYGPRYSE